METQNLWPDFAIETTKSPKAILKEQAGYLMEKTKNVLSADVETSHYKGSVSHEFYVVVPALNNYRYRLFSVSHEAIGYYPLTVVIDDNNPWETDAKIGNEKDFLSGLSNVFKAPETVRVISSLLSQSLTE